MEVHKIGQHSQICCKSALTYGRKAPETKFEHVLCIISKLSTLKKKKKKEKRKRKKKEKEKTYTHTHTQLS